jgi:hypothetical protein
VLYTIELIITFAFLFQILFFIHIAS